MTTQEKLEEALKDIDKMETMFYTEFYTKVKRDEEKRLEELLKSSFDRVNEALNDINHLY